MEAELPRPVYWKPRYPTRVMRERAFAKQQLAHEERLRLGKRRPSLLGRVQAWLRR